MITEHTDEIREFAQTKNEREKNAFLKLADKILSEHEEFKKELSQPAVPLAHQDTSPGHGHLIEFCTEPDSMLGKVAEKNDVHVVRVTKQDMNAEKPETINQLLQYIEDHPGCDIWASLPCGPWSRWQSMNSFLYGKQFRVKLEKERRKSKKLLKSFALLARRVALRGGRVTFEWPRDSSGWALNELKRIVRDLGMELADFDGCSFGLVNDKGEPHLKRWRLATSDSKLRYVFEKHRCEHEGSFQHAPIVGKHTAATARYPIGMCETIVDTWYPILDAPAMPLSVVPFEEEHREKDEEPEILEPFIPIFESVDTLEHDSLLALVGEEDASDLADSEPEEEDPPETRERRLKREAQTLEHMLLHEKKNPFCAHCCRGRMLKKYGHRTKDEPSEVDRPYERATEFGQIVEADNIFPAHESIGIDGEKTALLVRDRFSGVCLVYPQMDRSEDSNYTSLKHFAGNRLSGVTSVVFKSDAAEELTAAASRLCWTTVPSIPRTWPHNSSVERDIRAVKELCRPIHLQAGFGRKLWTVSVAYAATARSCFGACPVLKHERGTEVEETKKRKTRWSVATGEDFSGPKFPLGGLCFYKSRDPTGDIAQPPTRPALFAGWRIEPGLRYRDTLLVLDYESVRQKEHLFWKPKSVPAKEVFLTFCRH